MHNDPGCITLALISMLGIPRHRDFVGIFNRIHIVLLYTQMKYKNPRERCFQNFMLDGSHTGKKNYLSCQLLLFRSYLGVISSSIRSKGLVWFGGSLVRHGKSIVISLAPRISYCIILYLVKYFT